MKFAILTGGALIGLGLAGPASADTVTCESQDGRERYCGADTNGGVTLTTQLSSSGCYQGDTWGYDRRGIWVNGGCRAVFSTGRYNGYNYHSGNDYYAGDRRQKNNDGATAAIAIGAILGAAIIASAASKKKSGGDYESARDAGCNAGRQDRRNGQSMSYYRHSGAYGNNNEQAFSSGYSQCWQER